MTDSHPITEVLFVGGITRAVYVDEDGRQYVLDDEGQKVYGLWLHPDRWPEPDFKIGSPIHRP